MPARHPPPPHRPLPASEALRALLPPVEAGDPVHRAAFRALADLLLNRATLVAGGVPHRLVELELYFYGGRHLDEFSHRDPIQRDVGLWYFHKQGKSYRGGSYKGLDITFGHGGSFGGILLRAAEEPGELVEGPSRLVDHLLRLTASPSIAELAARFDLRIDAPRESGPGSPLFIALDEGPGRGQPVYESPRIGLSLKRGNVEHKQQYLARPYRFLTGPARIRKGKAHLALSLHRQGMSPGEISRVLGTRASLVQQYVEAYERGRSRSPADFRGELSSGELCALLGACHRFW